MKKVYVLTVSDSATVPEASASGKSHTHTSDDRLPLAAAADDIMQSPHYHAYIKAHGYHFTDSLATCAISNMENADHSNHRWTIKQVSDAYKAAGFTKPSEVTCGDIAYLANMAYADFYPALFKTEADCIRYADAVVNDPDGYKEMTFLRYLADLIGKHISFDWSHYMD